MRGLLVRCLSFVLFVLMPVATVAQTGGYRLKVRSFEQLYAEQRRLVAGYCRNDFEGARLSPTGFERLKPFLSYHTNPEFGFFTIISRYEIAPPDGPSQEMNVSYKLVGRWRNELGYEPLNSIQNVLFRFVDRDEGLLINDVDPGEPRVSTRAALNYFRQQLAVEKSDEGRRRLEEAINAIAAAQGGNPGTGVR